MTRPVRVLIVEESRHDAELLVRQLEGGGFAPVHERVGTESAMRDALTLRPWDLVIAGHSAPPFDAMAALDLLSALKLDIPFIIMSGTIGEERAVQLMKAGASDYIDRNRPGRLLPVVARELADARERRERRRAEQAFREREQRSVLQLATAYEATLEGWGRALDLRDRETEGHSRRVTELAVRLARRMGVGESDCVHLRRGALLHDIGKMGVPDNILHKGAELTVAEWAVMQRHPEYARELLYPIEFLRPALAIPHCHHEKWDGSGYPRRLAGTDIPLAARIFAAVDIWDALLSERPYRPRWSARDARNHIASLAGTHLDPAVVAAFLELLASEGTGDDKGPAAVVGRTTATRILVVDDFQANVELFQRWLAAAGHEVLTADSGASALAGIAEYRPDLVLLDVEIPAPNGLAVCHQLKRNPATRHIAVIIMSGMDPKSMEPLARQVGADDYLTKPVDGYELRTRIRLLLERSRRAGGHS